MPPGRSVLAEVATVDPGDGLPLGRYPCGVLVAPVPLPPAIRRIAVGVVAVEVGVSRRHVDERGMTRQDPPGRVDDFARGIGRRGRPVRHLGLGDQKFAGEIEPVVERPRCFAEPLPAPGVLHQVHERRVLEPAHATHRAHVGNVGVRAAQAFAVRIHDGDVAHSRGVSGSFGECLERDEDRGRAGAGPAAAWVFRIGADSPVPFDHLQRGSTCESERSDGISASQHCASDQSEPLIPVRAVEGLVSCFQFDAVEIRAGDEVDDAGDGIGAVGRGGTVAEHFEAFEGGHGQQVHVHHQLRLVGDRTRGPRQPAAVQQHQRSAGAESPQVHGGPVCAGSGPVLVGLAVRALAERQVADEFDDAG